MVAYDSTSIVSNSTGYYLSWPTPLFSTYIRSNISALRWASIIRQIRLKWLLITSVLISCSLFPGIGLMIWRVIFIVKNHFFSIRYYFVFVIIIILDGDVINLAKTDYDYEIIAKYSINCPLPKDSIDLQTCYDFDENSSTSWKMNYYYFLSCFIFLLTSFALSY